MRYIKNYENKEKMSLKDRNYKYYIDTMGCELNNNDSLKYSGIMSEMGLDKTDKIDEANIVLFNTCSIRENAEKTLYGRLGALKVRKQNDKNLFICVVGCMSQQRHVLEKIKKSYPSVDIVLGTHSMNNFANNLYKAINEKKKSMEYIENSDEILEEVPIIYESKTKASVSIIYGCNNFCSYCIVPYVRGRERSREPEDILKDLEKIVKRGYKEVILLGQNVNSYGNDFKEKRYNFANLLRDIEKIEGLEIIRFVSPHPKDFTDELIEVISKSKKIARQIHLPLQSGSTKILEVMNRKYNKEQFLELAKRIKERVKDVTFSTDIIVGFPGETEEDFKETLDVVNEVAFSQIYMFIYSKRKGTKAEKMEYQIDDATKTKRLQILKEKFAEIVYKENEDLLGETFEVLVEGKSKTNDSMYTGRLENNKIVVFKAKEEDINKIKKIKIISNNLWFLTGEVQN